MRQTYLTSDNPTVVNRLRKDCREYARQRELEEWFENIHHVRLAWKEDMVASEPSKELKPSCPRRP